jgi:hypothetical protein
MSDRSRDVIVLWVSLAAIGIGAIVRSWPAVVAGAVTLMAAVAFLVADERRQR